MTTVRGGRSARDHSGDVTKDEIVLRFSYHGFALGEALSDAAETA